MSDEHTTMASPNSTSPLGGATPVGDDTVVLIHSPAAAPAATAAAEPAPPVTEGTTSPTTLMSATTNFFRRYGPSGSHTHDPEVQLINLDPLTKTRDEGHAQKSPTGNALIFPTTEGSAFKRIEADYHTVTPVITSSQDDKQLITSASKTAIRLPKTGRSRKGSRAPQPPIMTKLPNSATRSSSAKTKNIHGNVDPVQRPCQAHSFHTDAAEVQKMERELLTLLGDFNSGKLRAFGHGCSMEQMEGIRDQQESLAKLHFDLGAKQDLSGPLTEEGVRSANESMDRLMTHLERLSVAIGELDPASMHNEDSTNSTNDGPVQFSVNNHVISENGGEDS